MSFQEWPNQWILPPAYLQGQGAHTIRAGGFLPGCRGRKYKRGHRSSGHHSSDYGPPPERQPRPPNHKRKPKKRKLASRRNQYPHRPSSDRLDLSHKDQVVFSADGSVGPMGVQVGEIQKGKSGPEKVQIIPGSDEERQKSIQDKVTWLKDRMKNKDLSEEEKFIIEKTKQKAAVPLTCTLKETTEKHLYSVSTANSSALEETSIEKVKENLASTVLEDESNLLNDDSEQVKTTTASLKSPQIQAEPREPFQNSSNSLYRNSSSVSENTTSESPYRKALEDTSRETEVMFSPSDCISGAIQGGATGNSSNFHHENTTSNAIVVRNRTKPNLIEATPSTDPAGVKRKNLWECVSKLCGVSNLGQLKYLLNNPKPGKFEYYLKEQIRKHRIMSCRAVRLSDEPLSQLIDTCVGTQSRTKADVLSRLEHLDCSVDMSDLPFELVQELSKMLELDILSSIEYVEPMAECVEPIMEFVENTPTYTLKDPSTSAELSLLSSPSSTLAAQLSPTETPTSVQPTKPRTRTRNSAQSVDSELTYLRAENITAKPNGAAREADTISTPHPLDGPNLMAAVMASVPSKQGRRNCADNTTPYCAEQTVKRRVPPSEIPPQKTPGKSQEEKERRKTIAEKKPTSVDGSLRAETSEEDWSSSKTLTEPQILVKLYQELQKIHQEISSLNFKIATMEKALLPLAKENLKRKRKSSESTDDESVCQKDGRADLLSTPNMSDQQVSPSVENRSSAKKRSAKKRSSGSGSFEKQVEPPSQLPVPLPEPPPVPEPPPGPELPPATEEITAEKGTLSYLQVEPRSHIPAPVPEPPLAPEPHVAPEPPSAPEPPPAPEKITVERGTLAYLPDQPWSQLPAPVPEHLLLNNEGTAEKGTLAYFNQNLPFTCDDNMLSKDYGIITQIKVIGESLLAASEDGNVYSFSSTDGKYQKSFEGEGSPVKCFILDETRHEPLLIFGSKDGHLFCYALTTGHRLDALQVTNEIQCLDSRWGIVYIGTKSGSVLKYDLAANIKYSDPVITDNGDIFGLHCTMEESRRVLIVASKTNGIQLMSAEDGMPLRDIVSDWDNPLQKLASLLPQQRNIKFAALLADIKFAIDVNIDKVCYSKPLRVCCNTHSQIFIAGFSNPGAKAFNVTVSTLVSCLCIYEEILYVGCSDGSIRRFNVKTCEQLEKLTGNTDNVVCMDVIADKIIVARKGGVFDLIHLKKSSE